MYTMYLYTEYLQLQAPTNKPWAFLVYLKQTKTHTQNAVSSVSIFKHRARPDNTCCHFVFQCQKSGHSLETIN